MLNATAPIAPPQAASGPAAAEAPSDAPDSAFAQALDQAEAQQRDARQAEGADKAAPAKGRRATPQAQGAPRPGAAPADTRPGDTPAAGQDAATDAPAATEHDEATAADPSSTQPTPQELAAWVTALPLPPAPATAHGAAAGTAADATAAADAELARASRASRKTETPTPAPAAEAAGTVSGKEHAATTQAAAGTPAPPEPAHEARPRSSADIAPAADAARPVATHEAPAAAADMAVAPAPVLPAPAGTSAGGPARSAGPAAPFHAELRVPVGSDDFAPALGARLSVLVRDGIEHAQLKLNPAELGPIEVRIDLDGPRAQVDFSAAHASTRQALQDAVPALASALRESGLTLTGGGVFEQPREQRGDAAPRPGSPGGSATGHDIDDRVPAAVPRPVRARGVLDLYA